MTVERDVDVRPRLDRQSENTVLYLEPVACGQHQPSSMGHCGVRVVSLSLSIVVEYSSGCDDAQSL